MFEVSTQLAVGLVPLLLLTFAVVIRPTPRIAEGEGREPVGVPWR